MDEVFEFRWRFVMRDESIACLRAHVVYVQILDSFVSLYGRGTS